MFNNIIIKNNNLYYKDYKIYKGELCWVLIPIAYIIILFYKNLIVHIGYILICIAIIGIISLLNNKMLAKKDYFLLKILIIISHLFLLYPLINFKKYIKLNKSNILLGICGIIIAIVLPYWPYDLSRKLCIFYEILIFFILFIFEKYHENNKLIKLL